MKEISYLSPLKEFAESGKLNWIDGNQLWVQQYPYDSWTHPFFNDTTIDHDRAVKLKESFDKGVRGTKLFADYEHGLDRAKGNKAAGEIMELKVVDEPRGAFTNAGLWARVQFNDVAKAEIEKGEWNYWSTTHFDEWEHPQTHEVHEMVYDGGGLTNKPYVKGMAPLNFSEVGLTEENAKTFSVWSTKYINDLPDSSFLYIEPGGSKDGEGKTAPRSLRHFPVKDSDGSVDLPHVRNAIARAPQSNSVSASIKTMVQNKARKMLAAKSHAEQLEVFDEQVDLDEPVVDDDNNDDNNEGGDNDVKLEELEKELRTKLGIADDADIVKAVGDLNDEVTPMREALKQHNEKKAFTEAFPAEAKRLEQLEAKDKDREAKQFAESFTSQRLTKTEGEEDKQTTLGYSGLVVQEIEKLAKSFSDGTADLNGVKAVLDSITNNGIVDYGTRGSSREDNDALVDGDAVPAGGMREVRKQFAEKVTELMRKDEIPYESALALAVDKYPKLADAYRSAGMGN